MFRSPKESNDNDDGSVIRRCFHDVDSRLHDVLSKTHVVKNRYNIAVVTGLVYVGLILLKKGQLLIFSAK